MNQPAPRYRYHLETAILVLTILTGASTLVTAQAPPADLQNLLYGRDIFYDADGLIVHKTPDGQLDGGDTAQREGWYWLGVWIRQNTPGLPPWEQRRELSFDQVLRLLEPNGDGVFYRHPKQPPFNNPHDKKFGFSRDQMIPLVAAMGVWGRQDAIMRLWDALPEDLLGKHSFNGDWRNFLGQAGPNCTEIKKRDCSPHGDCSLKVDDRACSLKTDNRDCSLKTDDRDCSLQVDNRDCPFVEDTRSCGHDIGTPFGSIHVNDPVCEAAKAAENAARSAAKVSCETQKATQNAAYAATKASCESAKSAQNVLYAGEKAACEAAKEGQQQAYAAAKATCETEKATQNGAYAAEKAACEATKTAGKLACEGEKQIAYQLCRLSNVHSGDLIGPQTVNLFRRALNLNPLLPTVDSLEPTLIQGGLAGETELLINAHLRVAQTQKDKDDVGDDLNHIVYLLMAKLRFPTPISDEAARVYRTQRPHSYGSYLRTYYAAFGEDYTDLMIRMDRGIASGWAPDVSAPIGAVRWYHRANTGANPQLATLYVEIIERFIK